MTPNIEIDPINKTIYLKFHDGLCDRTINFMGREDVMVDLSKDGKLLGLEILNIDIPRSVLSRLAITYRTPFLKKFHPEKVADLVA